MKATPAQVRAICYNLWQLGAKWTPEAEALIEDLERITASDVIGALRGEEPEMGLDQLRHLGIDV